LNRNRVIAIVPPPLPTGTDSTEPLDVIPVLSGWVRGTLVGVAVGLVAVFAMAIWINPYGPDGQPLRMASHTQLGLLPCTFYVLTKLPCPSCGMTTSFALLMRGDLLNSLRANAVGTLLAVFCLALVPWCVISAARQRTYFVRAMDRTLTILMVSFFGLMLLRWVVVVTLIWWSGAAYRI
jgi:hypothetical protein